MLDAFFFTGSALSELDPVCSIEGRRGDRVLACDGIGAVNEYMGRGGIGGAVSADELDWRSDGDVGSS